jgi:NAD(P)-dependent dehydrogenase (short-subunit alcohol dehydrogenase family)
MRAELPHLPTSGCAIVNTASVAGVISCIDNAAYTASKHGVIGITKTEAAEYAVGGVRINALLPGLTRSALTDRTENEVPSVIRDTAAAMPNGRVATASEMAAAALWLCSSSASYVTGHSLIVDAGLTAP